MSLNIQKNLFQSAGTGGSAQTEGTLKGSIGKIKCFHSLEKGVFLKTAHGKNCRSCKFFWNLRKEK